MKTIAVLGSTGSIGEQTLEVLDCLGGYKVLALAAYKNIELLKKQIIKYKPELAVVYDPDAYKLLKNGNPPCDLRCGEDGLLAAAACGAGTVVNALVGGVGLKPTLAAIGAGSKIALANKESIVTGGRLVMDAAVRGNVPVIPIDSEHSAIFQCLASQTRAGEVKAAVSALRLTASGGPFLHTPAEQLRDVQAKDALRHPTWKMGPKITIDSATLMNKGFEVIEAYWLFGLDTERINVLIHPQSIIHSLVEFIDGSVIAQMGLPDMRLPIQYALTHPHRVKNPFPKTDFTKLPPLTFATPDTERFPCLGFAYDALKQGGTAPAVLNYANEAAVSLFLAGEIRFSDIPPFIEKALNEHTPKEDYTISDIEEIKAYYA